MKLFLCLDESITKKSGDGMDNHTSAYSLHGQDIGRQKEGITEYQMNFENMFDVY